MATKTPKYQGHANPAAHRAVIERARSNAGVAHDPRPNRQRTRQARDNAAKHDFD